MDGRGVAGAAAAPQRVDPHCLAGRPTEIFEVTPELVEHQDRFAKLISHRIPSSEIDRAFELALTPGVAEKVVVTYDA